MGWFGIDLDGTLAEYHGWQGEDHIGAPIPSMVARVKKWLKEGRDVRIFTARVAEEATAGRVRTVIEEWCVEHIGSPLPVTNIKDHRMVQLWDDRAIQVETNTGRVIRKSRSNSPDVT